MRHAVVNAFAGVPGRTLLARGGALRTFGGLALLLALALLIVGIYLIEDQFTNPLASQSIGLFAAAFVLASALALLYELIELPRIFWRSGGQRLAGLREAAKAARAANSPVACAARSPARALCDLRANLPYQRCYVDRVRVRS
jgi:hypothetical protein